ncbi:DUF4132 domain-containing protein [Nocardia sp. NPDC051832]|uniref:DUF4132 domain-containing protein n=1 Tax=Nocardia sp. NPDC051832 TaxID=3155673 RepID=UPI00341D754C
MTFVVFEAEPEATEVPRQWWAKAEPFRGLGPDRRCEVDAAAVARFEARLRDIDEHVQAVLNKRGTDPRLAELGRAYLASPEDATPQEAAVIGLILLWSVFHDFGAELADYLVSKHDSAFAAATMVAMSELSLGDPRRPGMTWSSWVGELSIWREPTSSTGYLTQAAMRRMRALLAAAPQAEYDATRARLATMRTGAWPANLASTFLLPTEQDWLASDLAMLSGSARSAPQEIAVTRLLACVRTPDQADAVIAMIRPSQISFRPELIHSLGVQLGLDSPGVLVRVYRRVAEAKPRRRVVTMLQQLDIQEALTALLDLQGGPYILPAILDVAARTPRRALWVFGVRNDSELFRDHIRRHPEVARAAAECVLPQQMGEVLNAELATLTRSNVAPEELVPELLRTPPWLRPKSKPQVVTGLEPPAELLREWYSYPSLDPGLVRLASPHMLRLAMRALERRTLRATAFEWFRIHHEFAVPLLIPTAVGKPGRDRKDAGNALRVLVEIGFRDEIVATATEYGGPALSAVRAVLDTDLSTVLPARVPSLPEWLALTTLPPIVLAESTHSLPLPAVGTVITMAMLSQPGVPYSPLAQVKSLCEPASLAAAMWEVHEQWRRAGAHTRDAWVWEALGGLGDDSTVQQLLDLIRADSADARAVSALDALVAIGSDAALLALKTVSEKVKTSRVREGARDRVTAIAEGLGLSPDQLADRLVPDLGLRPDGTTLLDFGPRQFVVALDEQLRATVRTLDGTPRATLPKPSASDDPDLAAAAATAFRKLKKNAVALGADQITRLERAMLTGRRFSLDELRTLFIDHPLRRTLTRRIVWAVYDGDALRTAFRVAEDSTFADLSDNELHLPATAAIGVAHPLELGAATPGWTSLFADYELLQPFPQLARAVYTAPELAGASTITKFLGVEVESTRILGLPRRGWDRPDAEDGGRYYYFTKPLPADNTFVLTVTPIMHAGFPTDPLVRTIESAGLQSRTSRPPTFADLGPITTSEILRDLTWLSDIR